MKIQKDFKSDKDMNLAKVPLQKIAEEFGLEVTEFEGKPAVILPQVVERSLDEEQEGYDNFYVKPSGATYYSAPAIPTPMRVVEHDDKKLLVVETLTPDYGIVHEKGLINFQRIVRFFIHEAVNNALHYTEEPQQLEHPLISK